MSTIHCKQLCKTFKQGDEIITAETLAEQLGTIAYEVLTLPGPTWTRQGI